MFGAAQLDDETVAAAIEGHRQAVDRLVGAMTPQVRLMVMARLSPTPAQYGHVEELAQSVMVALLENLARIERRTLAGVKAYTSTIAARAVADLLRNPGGAGRGKPGPLSLDTTVAGASGAGPLHQFLSATGTSPLSAAARADQLQATLAELGRLKPEYREVITLAFFDQLATSQIAELLGTTRPAASMILIRAIKTLRRNLTGTSELRSGDQT